MQQLIDSIKKIKEILHESEVEGDTMADVLGKLGRIKVHKVPFPTMMLMEIIDEEDNDWNDSSYVSYGGTA